MIAFMLAIQELSQKVVQSLVVTMTKPVKQKGMIASNVLSKTQQKFQAGALFNNSKWRIKMKSTTLQKDILTETYSDMDNLICDIVWGFAARYGGEFDELKAEANLLFLSAVESYNEIKGAFTTWLYCRVWVGLQTFSRIERKHKHIELPLGRIRSKPAPNLFAMLNDLSNDGRTIAKIIFEPPEGLTDSDLEKGFNACTTRIYIKNYLKTRLGWTGKRIKESITEIRQILTEREA